jgi:hypothetical protein
MADSHKPVPTVFPPAVWRRLAEESKSDGEFLADMMEHAKLDNAADAAIRAELVQLAEQLYDQLIDRAERLIALGRLLPKARDEREAIALAGLVWEDSGLPQPLPVDGPWLPKDLSEARKLLAWLDIHPSRLPIP